MQKITEELKRVLESKVSGRVLLGIGVVILAFLIFSAGVAVGFHKAAFGRAWGEHYNENFGMGHKGGSKGDMWGGGIMGMGDYFPNAHGAIGKIIKIELPNIIVQDKDKTEKVILISGDTQIQKGRVGVPSTDLKIDDFVVIIGTPNEQGVIMAKLIRIFPSPQF